MHLQPAANTAEVRLSLPTRGVHDSARMAGLRAVVRGHLDKLAAGPRELVAQALHQAPPACIEDASCQPAVGSHHVADHELLNDHGAVALGVGGAEILYDVLALPADLAVQPRYANFSFLSVFRLFLATGDGALGVRKALHRSRVEARSFDDVAVAVGDDVHDATVERDHGLDPLHGLGNLELARDRDKPLLALSTNGAGLGNAFEWTVHYDAEIAKLGKPQTCAQAPNIRVWLAQAQPVATFALESRGAREPFETALPCLVELDKQLRTDVARNIREPRQLSAELGELVDLIECCVVPPLVSRTAQTKTSLLEREVPQEAQRVLPCVEPIGLLNAGVHAVAKRLPDQHASEHSLVYAARYRFSRWKACCVLPHRSPGLRAEYRRKVITERVFAVLRASWADVCPDFEAELREAAYEDDHVHMLVAYPPKVALSKLVNSLKGVSHVGCVPPAFRTSNANFRALTSGAPATGAVSCGFGTRCESAQTRTCGRAS